MAFFRKNRTIFFLFFLFVVLAMPRSYAEGPNVPSTYKVMVIDPAIDPVDLESSTVRQA